ncbi:MAG: ABC-2 family transporter protein [Roseiflexaceae bacterium]|nr:ABC-2 family transporter protein [Roseiflexaceae bacterium]
MTSLYFRLIGARIRSQMQYKLSFWLDMAGFGLLTWIEFAVTFVLLSRFQSIGGWGIAEVALLYGLSSIAYSIAEMAGRGFDRCDTLIQTGNFDVVLTRPLGSFFQVLCSDFQLRRLGRTFQGAAVLIYALTSLHIVWTPERLLVIPVTIASGAVIFIAILMIGAAMCFWTVKTPEIINIFTAGGQQMTCYPQSIFNQWIRGVFLFVVPVAFASYPAGLLILGRSDPNGLPAAAAWAAPLAATLFFLAALGFWRVGVSKYTSTGS